MTNRLLQRGFAGGEIAPSMLARTDLPHYKMGAFKLDNFFVLPQGAIRARSGFKYVGTPLNPYKQVRLIPFRYSSTQTFILEFTDLKMRIISNGAYVLNGNNIYEVTSPYSAENLKYIDFSQNADIITLTSNLYPPYELRRYSNTDWRFVRVSLAPEISAPTITSVTAVYANAMTDAERATKDKITVTYVVTAFDENDRESVASTQASGVGNYYINGAKIKVSWSAVAGATRYRLYRSVSGIFGYVGETENLYIDDEGLNPDTTITPPRYKSLFVDSSQAITSVSINTGGSGYNYGQIGSLTYLPRSLSIDAIQPFTSAEGAAETDVSSWVLSNPRIEFVNGITSQIELTFPLEVEYAVKEISGDTTTYRKIAYLANPQVLTLTASKLSIAQCTVRFKCDNVSVEKHYLGFDEQPTDKQDNVKFNALDTGLSIGEYLQAFPQITTVQIPLTISDQVGVNADIDAVAIEGTVSAIIVNSVGYSYSAQTSATLDSSIGSGATFTVNTTGDSLPDYPSTCTQYDQRRVFAGSNPHPLKCWFTNAGQQDLMAYHLPTLDDDRIEIEAVTSDADRIKHAVALESLLLFTSTSELRVYTQNSDALTPKSVAVRAQSYVGANEVQPVVANNTIIYAASRGGHIRALGYDYSQAGYITQDIALRAPHLFDNFEIESITLAKSPVQIIWCVSSNGSLLSCTYFPEQQLVAWAQHHTKDGLFEDVCAVSEGQEDHVYAVVNRGGIRYIERLSDLMIAEEDDYYRYLDSYLDAIFTHQVSNITGLNHLEGKYVSCFVDGVQEKDEQGNVKLKKVTNGAVTLDSPGYHVAVGLPIEATLITLPLIHSTEAELQGRTKNITEVYLRLSHDGNVKANTYPSSKLYVCKKDDIYMQNQDLESYLVKVSIDGEWSEQGQIKVIHDDALPLEIQSLVLNVSFEGGK